MSTQIDTVNPPLKTYPDPFADTFKSTRKMIGGVHKNPAGKRRVDLTVTGGKKEWPSLTLKFLTQTQRDQLETDLFSGNVLYLKFADRPSTVYTVVFGDPGEMPDECITQGDGVQVYHVTINKLMEQ